jgi:hypothetical protein
MTELEQLTVLCRRLGAPEGQAETMARQLIKRAGQLAVERGQSREQAMAYLLSLVTQGSAGDVPKEFQPPEPPPVV